MSLSSWRQFPFFDCVPIKDPNFGSKDGKALYSDPTIASICSMGEYLVMAVGGATLKLADSQFHLVLSFQAYKSSFAITKLTSVYASKNTQILCTIAESQGQPVSLKLWDIDKLINAKKISYESDYLTCSSINNGTNDYPMTCFEASGDFSVLAFGFANGVVILVRGDLLRDKGSRQRIVYESKEPITSVHFKDDSLLYITTVSKVITISTFGRNNGAADQTLDSKEGSDINCSDLMLEGKHDHRYLVIARSECLQFYNTKGKISSLLLEVAKERLKVFKDRYVFLVTSTKSSLTSEPISFSSDTSSIVLTNSILAVDTLGKFIAFSRTIPSSVVDMFEMWGDLYVFGTDKILYKVHEKPLEEKMGILIQRELYPMALKLANDNSLTGDKIMEVEHRYADFLYEKRDDPGTAIKHYIQCIKLGKTSEVVRKYKDSSKIPYLTEYLEAMIDLKLTTNDHVTLLLCCYCKLKQDTKIKVFVDQLIIDDTFEVASTNSYKDFDREKVIELCRESDYFQLASFISKRFNLTSIVVEIQLEDLHDPKRALRYMRSLPVDDLLRVLLNNVKSLLNELPNHTTQLLIDVFTGNYLPENIIDTDQTSTISSLTIEPAEHPILTSYNQFLAFMHGHGRDKRPSETSTSEMSSISRDAKSLNSVEPKKPTYLPPRPKIIFKCFVNHPNEFVIFLEACIESYNRFGGNERDKKDIMITLYEMYLSLSSEDGISDESEKQWKDKARKLLQAIQKEKGWDVEDETSLLLLSTITGFDEGEMLVRESTDEGSESFGLDMFRSCIISGEYDKSYLIITKYGDKEPELYRVGLTTYASREDIYNCIGEERMHNLLHEIEVRRLMTPLEVIKQLSVGKGNFVKLGLIKNYLLNYIKKQKKEIDNNTKLVETYKKETADVQKSINSLIHDKDILNRAKCASCGQPLEIPFVHFKCSHSYHERCLLTSDNHKLELNELEKADLTCPRCASKYETIDILNKRRQELADKEDEFQASLEGSKDRFKVMMGFISRGAFDESSSKYDGIIPSEE